jgi:polysaccharide pyruvyl transferase WcaK-like protein
MKIGLLDHMGYGNLGDAAIQDVVIANIRKRIPNARLVGFSFMPSDTVQRHGIPCYPIRWSYPTLDNEEKQLPDNTNLKARLKSAVKKSGFIYPWAKPVSNFIHELVFWAHSYQRLRTLDLLIISGGGQLCELWHGPWSHPYTIFKFSVLTKLARRKLYLLNVGAGPLKHPLSKFFAKWAVRLADYRSFRDRDSQELIHSIGVKGVTHVYPDPVYALQIRNLNGASPTSKPKQGQQITPKPIIVGLNPIGFCDPRIWPRKDNCVYQEYIQKISQFSTWLLDQGYDLRVFTTETSVDRLAIEDLREQLSKASSYESLCQVFRSPSQTVSDALREMSGFDFIVTSKFHGIIFSHLLAKPVISLSYQRKMDVAMQALGQDRFCADIERFDVNWLINAFRSLVDESRSIKSVSAAAVETNAAKLSQQFDSLFLPDRP